MSTTQAPLVNFVIAKITVTTAVITAPTPFTIIFKRQRRSGVRMDPRSFISWPSARRPTLRQRRAIPACDRVKERKTPIA